MFWFCIKYCIYPSFDHVFFLKEIWRKFSDLNENRHQEQGYRAKIWKIWKNIDINKFKSLYIPYGLTDFMASKVLNLHFI